MARLVARRVRGESGMVTAELATALPVLVLLAFVAVAAVGVGQARVRCADAAREAARAIARGDPDAAPRLVRAVAGHGASVLNTGSGSASKSASEDTTVTVRLRLRPVSWLPPVTITETAVAATEPTGASAQGSP